MVTRVGLVLLSVVLVGSATIGRASAAADVSAPAHLESVDRTGFGPTDEVDPATPGILPTAGSVQLPLWLSSPATSVTAYPMLSLIGDVTGDGRDDLVGIENGDVLVLPGGGGPVQLEEAGGSIAIGTALADFNGDGSLDLAIGYGKGGVSVFAGGNSGGLGSEEFYATGPLRGFGAADVDQDGRTDVIVRPETSRQLEYLIQSPSGVLQPATTTNAPLIGSNEGAFAFGDFDGNGLPDIVAWPGLESFNSAGDPSIYLQTGLGAWSKVGEIPMSPDNPTPAAVHVVDVDGDGFDDIYVEVSVSNSADIESRLYWQGAGAINTSDPVTFPCSVGGAGFGDADANGRADIVCRGAVGITLWSQVADRVFAPEFYLNDSIHNSSPLLGDLVGDSHLDLITAFTDGTPSVYVYEGRTPQSLIGASGTISGSLSADGICVEAVSTHNGQMVADTISTGGSYSLEVPAGLYVLRYSDCRPLPRSPAGMSYLGYIHGGSDPIFLKSTSGSHVTVNLAPPLRRDMVGRIVDDVTGESLEGIRVWEGIQDYRIGGLYWIANATTTDSQGRFTKYGSYRQIDIFIDDPLGVYPPHVLYVHDDAGDIGTWGLVDPIMRDIRSSVFLADILWLRDTGITKGCNPPTNDMFCTNERVTRGQMAAFLVRFLDLSSSGSVEFVDDDDSIFESSIERLAEAGITKGCNPPANDRFCPDDFVTRGQMAAFLARALNLTDKGSLDFTDDDGFVFAESIERLAEAGITKGCNPPTNDRFCPHDYVTRGQMAAFLRRASRLHS